MEYVYFGFFINLCILLFILISGKIDYFSPFSLNVFCWFVVFLVGIQVWDSYNILSLKIFLNLMLWFFVLNSVFILMYFQNVKKSFIGKYDIKNEKIYIFFSFLSIFITVFEIIKVGSGGPYQFFLNLRLSLFSDDYSGVRYVVTPYLYVFMTALFAISILCDNSKKLKKLTIFWQILYIIASMGKLAILTPLIIYFVVKYIGYAKKIPKIKIMFFCTVFLLLSFVLNIIRKSDSYEKTPLIEMIGLYIWSPLIAFGELPLSDYSNGDYTFRFYQAFLYKVGLTNITPVNTVLEYVNIPIETNVFTIMQPFYQDFGSLGVFYGALFYSFVFSISYYMAVKNRGYFIILYAFLAPFLVTSFLGEFLLTNLALLLYLVFMTWIIWRFSVVKN